MGVMLSGGGSFAWLSRAARGRARRRSTARRPSWAAGTEGLLFAPYLSGERTPHADPHARGAFTGLSLRHDRGALARAAMEGVAYGLRDSLELLRELGVDDAVGRVSRRRLAQRALDAQSSPRCSISRSSGPRCDAGSAFGAALLAGVREGVFATPPRPSARCVRVTERIEPDQAWVAAYARGYSAIALSIRHFETPGGGMNLDGKTAVITGASRGIGAAVARQLHERGVNLGLASRSGDDLGLDGVVAQPCDVRDLGALVALCDATAERFGGIDIVVANAGVGAYGPFLDLSVEHLDEMIDVNLKGTLYAIRAALPHMLGREGDVITLASEAGRRGLPNEAVYCASKFGQVGFTRALDHELREQGIRCTNICPGGVATDFALDDGRGRTEDVLPGMMTAEDVAEVVVFAAGAPTTPAHPRDGAPADEGGRHGARPGEVGDPLDGAHQPADDPRGARVGEGRARRGREPRLGSRRGVCAGVGDRARVRLLRGAARRSRDRGGLHLAAEHDCTSSGRSGRSRPGSTCSARSRSRATRLTSRRRSTRRTMRTGS